MRQNLFDIIIRLCDKMLSTGDENMSNETFDVRLSREQIELIDFALRDIRIMFDNEKLNEINALIDMFENVEIDVLNSFVD